MKSGENGITIKYPRPASQVDEDEISEVIDDINSDIAKFGGEPFEWD